MNTTEKFCLKWNDFKDNIYNTFGALRDDQDLCDVTIVCEDGQQVGAHKIILAASSPFFTNVFREKQACSSSDLHARDEVRGSCCCC